MPDFKESKESTASGLRYAFKPGLFLNSPLIVGVHGKAGTLYVLNAFASVYPKEAALLYLEAPAADALGGFSWWDFDPVSEDAAAQWDKAQSPAKNLLTAIREVETIEQLEPAERIGIGFSQGGGLLSVALQLEPAFFHKVALLASFAVKTSPAPDLTGAKIYWAHGTNDERIVLPIAERSVEYLRHQNAAVTFVTDPVGHKVGSAGMRGLKEFLVFI